VRPESRAYQVRPGDTLAAIALRHAVDYQRIAADNQLPDPKVIRAGQWLRIGQPMPGVRVIQPGETLAGIASASGVSVAQLLAQNRWISNPDRIPAGAGLRVRP
jgi:LysM repeat protein